jgi:NADH:ubiquinone oxidoreductase subunit F (NADH-binding)
MTMGTPEAEGTRRLLACLDPTGGWVALAEHRARFSAPPRPASGPSPALIEMVEQAGLRGRGGAGFPTATKMRAVVEAGRRPVVVANGSEGEPASRKDEFLMSAAPHLVLDGAELAATAVGADEVICAVVLHTGRARQAIQHAIAERRAADPGGPRITTVDVPARYIAGEERSLVHLLNGGPAIPTASPPRPFERGVSGRPTLVQNVETLAHLALVHRFGPKWFRAVGVPEMPGTSLTTVSGAVATPAVYEIVTGTPLLGLLRAAGAVEEDIRAVLVGGYSGTWLSLAQARAVTLDREGLARVGAIFGPGVVSVLPRDACGLWETAGVMRWMADQTAGQCGPCVHGLAAIAGATEALARGTSAPGLVERLEGLAGQVDGRGACRYPDGAIRLLRSALGIFEADVRAHLAGDACPPAAHGNVLPLPVVPQVA